MSDTGPVETAADHQRSETDPGVESQGRSQDCQAQLQRSADFPSE